MPTKIGWKSHKIDEKSRRFINHFRDFFCVLMNLCPKTPFFVGVGVYEYASFSTSMSNIFSKPFSNKKISSILQWAATRWNGVQWAASNTGEKNSTFYSEGVVHRQKKSFASFFCKKKSLILKPSYQSPSTLSMNW